MKQVTAIIKPFMLAKVQEALQHVAGFPGMTVSDCRGMGQSHLMTAPKDRHPGVEFVHKVRLEIVVADDLAEQVVDVICHAAHTGNVGDGLVYITPVDGSIRVRTFDKDCG
jgi:nitrogen regulatory protein PII